MTTSLPVVHEFRRRTRPPGEPARIQWAQILDGRDTYDGSSSHWFLCRCCSRGLRANSAGGSRRGDAGAADPSAIGGNFVSQRACVSCHHNSLAVITLRMAQQRGFGVDAKALDAVEARTFRELRNANAFDDAVQVANLSDPTPNDSYLSDGGTSGWRSS